MGRPPKESTAIHHFKGVAISLYRHKRGDWEAGFTILGQGRKKASGATERECRQAAEDKIRKALDLDAYAALRDEEAARQLLKDSGVSLTESARFWLSNNLKPERLNTVAGVRELWLALMLNKDGKSHYHHWRTSNQNTSLLEERLGAQQISTITLAQLTDLQDEALLTRAPRTARNRHDATKALFIFARKRGFLVADRLSTAERLDRPKVGKARKGIFYADAMQRLIDTGWGYAMPGSVAMVTVGFGSVRSEEPCKQDPDEPLEHRIGWEDFKFDEGIIDIREEVSKTDEQRDAGLPANLKDMLLPLRGSGPIYTGKRLDLAFAAIAAKAGVPWIYNGLRHSCITYDMLITGNATIVANRSGNSPEMIERYYRNTRAKLEHAVAWFNLRPRVAWGAYLRPGYVKPMQA